MLRCVALIRTDVSEELSAPFIRVTRIGELGTTLAVTSNRCTLLSSSETSVLTRATWHNIPEVTILHSHCCENLKSYMLHHICMYLYISTKWITCKTWGFHNGKYEEYHLLGCEAVWLLLRTILSEEHTSSMMEVTSSSETSVLTRASWCNSLGYTSHQEYSEY
jgi:hypothetical protein